MSSSTRVGNARQRREAARRKARRSITAARCFSPRKVRYTTARQARAAATALHLAVYPCGDHYHLTSDRNGRTTPHPGTIPNTPPPMTSTPTPRTTLMPQSPP